MKIEILKEYLEHAVQLAARIANKNLSLPVLSCAVLSATGGRAVLRATNLDVSIEVPLKAKIISEGSVAVPAQVLHQLVAAATEQKVVISVSDTTLTISGSRGVSKLKTLDVAEFPTLPYVKEGEGVTTTLPAKELSLAFKSVSFAAASSGMRPELSSIFLKVTDGVLTAAATDSFRLAEMKLPTKSKDSCEPILLPARNTPEIIRVLGGHDTAEVRIGENQITFVVGGGFITSRVIDGAFPEYGAIIPKTFTSEATMLTEEVVRTLRKVSVFTDQGGQVELGASVSDKRLSFRATNREVGEAAEEVDAALQGDDIVLSFNIRYILDALGVVSSDSVCFRFSGSGKPLIISEVPDKGFTYLVMPMNR